MARRDHILVVRSLKDRLLGTSEGSEGFQGRVDGVRELAQSVERDLIDLLNARNSFQDLSEEYVEARRSVICYGLPDFTGLDIRSVRDQGRLVRMIEAAIRAFEPRLEEVCVNLGTVREAEQSVRFSVRGQLRLDPVPEPVTFDMEMQVHSNQVSAPKRPPRESA